MKLRTELETSSKAHKEEETSWRKRRNKAEGEVGNWISEYDKDMGAREAVLDEERAAYADLSRRLAVTLEQVGILKEARMGHEKSERERKQAMFHRAQKQRIQARARAETGSQALSSVGVAAPLSRWQCWVAGLLSKPLPACF